MVLKRKRLVVDIHPELHKALKLKAVEMDKELTVIVRALALGWLDGELELPHDRGHFDDLPKKSKPSSEGVVHPSA